MIQKPDINLPFFTYGVFRPGEISFLCIKDYTKSITPLKIKGKLLLRDGITLYTHNEIDGVDGYLIDFNQNDTDKAYEVIKNLEPENLFEWGIINTLENKSFNILIGKSPKNGTEDIYESDWKTIWEDPFFKSAIEVLDEFEDEEFDFNLKPLFKLQMKYMLLWTIIERFTFFRYSLGGKPHNKNIRLSENPYFIEALKICGGGNRVVVRSDKPKDKYTFNINTPKKAIEYYYQIRCNITHRGKAVYNDYDKVKKSFYELFEITKFILKKTKEECDLILKNINENYDSAAIDNSSSPKL